MSAHRLIEFLPPSLREAMEAGADPGRLESRSSISETVQHAQPPPTPSRKRRLSVSAWAEGRRSELPIVERHLPDQSS